MNLETTIHARVRFTVGDTVEKINGDYSFKGIIVGMFTKTNQSAVRVVVENSDRILHIFSPAQLNNLTPNKHESRQQKEQPNGSNIICPTVSAETI